MPKKLIKQGVKDMVRLSDRRMSGTSYGAIFSRHVKQANEGCDFDFLEGTAPTAEPEIH